MPELNLLATLLVVALLVLWNLDFLATLLTLKNLKPELPEEFRGVWDDEKYLKSQSYEKAQAQFGIVSSISSLTILLAFWFFGGFGSRRGRRRGRAAGRAQWQAQNRSGGVSREPRLK